MSILKMYYKGLCTFLRTFVKILIMKTVSVTEFRGNIKKYLDIAETEKLVIHRSKGRSFVVIPLEDEDDECLLSNKQKVAIDQALEDVANNKVHSHEDVMEETKKRFPHLFNR
jgi:PHD/YefM family antitoxin component YafN of YafNO toxin-antitoxin module